MSVTVTWAKGTDQTIGSYRLERAPTSTGSWSTVVTVSGTTYLNAALGTYEYVDQAGDFTSWYRITAIDIYSQPSPPSPAFQSTEADPPLVSLAYLKTYLGASGTADDALLQNLIDAASSLFETQTGQSFALRLYDESQDGNDERTVALRHTPVQEVVSVSIDEVPVTQSVSVGSPGWFQDGCLVRLRGTQAFNPGDLNVRVVYTAGPRSVPADVQQAVTEMVALKYKERTHVGRVSDSTLGSSVSYLPSQIPMSVQRVIDSYRRVWF